ncbi:Error-prone repair protein ImuA [Pedobacter sp. JY14-1]|uniref:ImuA family protein n=1 Tax=Pedobacter sp. JY14-1 TaxID=3034151 RepID=UPI0023E1FBB1|nr:Error-prone repair protein ImuA [Pedobacter sp. JY14-1]
MIMEVNRKAIIQQLQQQILVLQGMGRPSSAEPDSLGLGTIEAAFPGGCFPCGHLHEFICGTVEETAAAAGFIAGLLSRIMKGNACLWISRSAIVFPLGIGSFNVDPERIIFVHSIYENEIIWAMEEALKCSALSAVIAELPEISFNQSRRLQLAAEKSNVTGIILRNTPKNAGNTACAARWQVSHLPSYTEDGLPGVGFPSWQVKLLKVRNGRPGIFRIVWNGGHFLDLPQPHHNFVFQRQEVG